MARFLTSSPRSGDKNTKLSSLNCCEEPYPGWQDSLPTLPVCLDVKYVPLSGFGPRGHDPGPGLLPQTVFRGQEGRLKRKAAEKKNVFIQNYSSFSHYPTKLRSIKMSGEQFFV